MSETEGSIEQILKGGAILLVATALDHILQFVGKLLAARFFTPSDIGVISIAATVMSIVTLVAMLGVDIGIARYLPREEQQESTGQLVRAGLLTVVLLSVLLSVVIFVLAPLLSTSLFGNPELTAIFRIAALLIPFATLNRFAIGVSRGRNQVLPRVLITHLVSPTTRVFAIIIAILLAANSIELTIAYLSPVPVAAFISVYYLARRTPISERFDLDEAKELLSFSFPLLLSGLMSFILIDIDTFLIEMFMETDDVGVYNIAYTVANIVLIFMGTLSFLFMPEFSRHHSNENQQEMADLYEVFVLTVMILTLPIVALFIIRPGEIITFLFGSEYASGALALGLLALGFLTHLLAGPNKNALVSVGKNKLVMWVTFVTAILNVLLNVIFIPRFGIVGAGAATMVSYTFMNIVFAVALFSSYHIHPVNRKLIYLFLGSPILLLISLRVIAQLDLTGPINLMALVSVYGVLHLSFCTKVVMGDREWEAVKNITASPAAESE